MSGVRVGPRRRDRDGHHLQSHLPRPPLAIGVVRQAFSSVTLDLAPRLIAATLLSITSEAVASRGRATGAGSRARHPEPHPPIPRDGGLHRRLGIIHDHPTLQRVRGQSQARRVGGSVGIGCEPVDLVQQRGAGRGPALTDPRAVAGPSVVGDVELAGPAGTVGRDHHLGRVVGHAP